MGKVEGMGGGIHETWMIDWGLGTFGGVNAVKPHIVGLVPVRANHGGSPRTVVYPYTTAALPVCQPLIWLVTSCEARNLWKTPHLKNERKFTGVDKRLLMC